MIANPLTTLSLTEFDKSINLDKNLKEEYFLAKVHCATPHQDKATYIANKLSQLMEMYVTTGLENQSNWPESVAEYFTRIEAYKRTYMMHSDYSRFYLSLAEEALADSMYNVEGSYWHTDIEKIVQSNSDKLTVACEWLIEYRTLRGCRPQLDRERFVDQLHHHFVKRIEDWKIWTFKREIEMLRAELSLLLSDAERKGQLKETYYTRLEVFQSRAKTAAIIERKYELIPWQWFTTKYVSRTCLDFVRSSVYNNPEDIDFELTLDLPFSNKSDLMNETSELAAEWLVLDWIKNELTKVEVSFQDDTLAPASSSDSGQATSTQLKLTARERMLIHCYEQKHVIRKGETNYNDYITYATPSKRLAYCEGKKSKAKPLIKSIRKVIPLLSREAAQQAISEVHTIEAQI